MGISWKFHGDFMDDLEEITVFGVGKPTHFDSSHIFDMSSF